MDRDRGRKIRLIYDEAASLIGDAQEIYLRAACEKEPALYDEVRSLLSRTPDTLDLPVTPLLDTVKQQRPEIAGYRIIGEIGVGGMGTVYEAEQLSTQRRVAIKSVHSHTDDDLLRERLFEREIQTLARLEHPGIATLYESFRAGDGALCFAMELVRGTAWDSYVPQVGSPDRDRTRHLLELFATLCDAVQYAHQKGVIHRDLKPSNILVVESNEAPRIKVLDFGLARLVGDDATQTQLTEVGSIRGTLRYMSPEQASGDPDSIDLRSDIYSLGVMLYQLLTNELPHDISGKSLVSALKVIGTQQPRTMTKFTPGLDEDLQLITLKALQQDPDERYQSAHGLADDIRRYLQSVPINARAPTTWYSLRKLVRRHRLPAALIAGLFLTTVGAAVAMGILYARADRSLARATMAEAATQREAETARRVSAFLVDLFEVADPSQSRGETVTARELLDAGVKRIETELLDEPLVRASLKQTMGTVYRSLGLYASADPLISDALDAQENAYGENSLESLDTLSVLTSLRYDQGRYEESLQLAEQLLAAARSSKGEAHADVGIALGLVSSALTLQGRFTESEPAALEGLRIIEGALGPNDEITAGAVRKVGALYTAMHRYDDAGRFIDRELAIRRALPDDELGVGGALHERAEVYFRQKEYELAEVTYQQALEIMQRILGPNHPYVAFEYNNLGVLYRRMKRPADAEVAYRRALDIRERILPADHPMIAWTLDNLGLLLVYENRLDEAEPLLNRARVIAEKAVGVDHPDYGILLNNFARLRERQGRLAEAIELQSGQIKIIRATYDPMNLNLGTRLSILAEMLDEHGKPAEALVALEEAIAIFKHHDDAEELEIAAPLLAKLSGDG